MTEAPKTMLQKILNSRWVITLSSTMLGILVGFYLTNFNENRQLHHAKADALTQVMTELNNNEQLLQKHHEIISSEFNAVYYLFSKINQEFKIVIPKDSLTNFRNVTKEIFRYRASEEYGDDMISVKGDFDINFTSELIVQDLSDIVWTSFKQTQYLTITPFKCITSIEGIYHLQEDVNQLNKDWRDRFFIGKLTASQTERDAFFGLWHNLLEKQKLLLQFYDFRKEALETCTS